MLLFEKNQNNLLSLYELRINQNYYGRNEFHSGIEGADAEEDNVRDDSGSSRSRRCAGIYLVSEKFSCQ